MAPHVVLLPGDGIGPEIIAADARASSTRSALTSSTRSTCSAARRSTLTAPRSPTRRSRPASSADAVLLAAVGGPKWDTTDPAEPRPEQGLLGLRKGLGLFANLRPGPAAAGALRRQPAQARADRGHRPARRPRADRRHLLRREDAHRGQRLRRLRLHARGDRADRAGRVRRRALARSPASTRPTCSRPAGCGARSSTRVHADEFPNIELEHLLVDNAAMQLVAAPAPLRRDPHREHVRRHPQRRGGDAHRLDRHAAERVARRAAARAVRARPRLGARHRRAAAIANPLAMFLSAALMLRHGLGMEAEAAAVESAVDRALADGLRTPDLGGAAHHGRGHPGRPNIS